MWSERVDAARIQIVKLMHRPVLDHIGDRIRSGCSCGTDRFPCETLAAALDAEQRQADARHNGHRFDG
jgi:hypothetical protein